MHTKFMIDVLAGFISLAIIVSAAYLYFTEFHIISEYHYVTEDTNITKYDNFTTYKPLPATFHLPTKPMIILRMDDFQGNVWAHPSINITDEVLRRNMSLVLGVIPDDLQRGDGRAYLVSKRNNPRIEIALHGMNHSPHEFRNLSDSEAFALMSKGKELLVEGTGQIPVTFIPPYNEYNDATIKAAKRLGFKIISAKTDEYKMVDSVFLMGFNERTKEYGDGDLTYYEGELESPLSIIETCEDRLRETNACVIMIHPQEYLVQGGHAFDPAKYAKLEELLDRVQAMNVSTGTFKDLIS